MSLDRLAQHLALNGYASVEDAFDEASLAEAERHLDALVLGETRVNASRRWDMAGGAAEPRQTEFIRPSDADSTLRRNGVYARCKAMAEGVFQGRAYRVFDHAIYKLPHNETETPWHQDQAYLGERIVVRSLHFWIPFQDVDSRNGTMRYVPGSHSRYRRHGPVGGQPRLLCTELVENDEVDHLVLRRGGVGVHTPTTLHSAGANETGDIRKAWIIHFSDRPPWRKRWQQLLQAFSE